MRRFIVFVVILTSVISIVAIGSTFGTENSTNNTYAMITLDTKSFSFISQDMNPHIQTISNSCLRTELLLREYFLKDRYPEIQLRYTFDYLFYGLSFCSSNETLNDIRKLPWVEDVYVLGELKPAGEISTKEMVTASNIYNMKDPEGISVTGAGIVVGVIDSGIDYNHGHLGHGLYGEAGIVIGGKNYVELGEDPIDDSPICHGTSVAGLITSENESVSIAPGAKLRSYKVYSNNDPFVREDVIIKAINQAVKDGCDIINISLSEPGGKSKSNSALVKTTNKAIEEGVCIVSASGDFGTYCNVSSKGTVGGPGLAEDAICVGAMDMRPGFRLSVDELIRPIKALATMPFSDFSKNDGIEIVDGAYGSEDDLSSLRVRNKIVLIKRGPEIGKAIPFYKKMTNARKRGAVGMICWNNIPGPLIQMQIGYDYDLGLDIKQRDIIPACFISNQDGLLLKKTLENNNVNIKVEDINLNQISRTTSIGPSEDLVLKPDLCAPGIGLTAPISLSTGSIDTPYTDSFSGSSASSAIVSGAVALMKQLYPEWNSKQIKLALMNNASLVVNPANGNPSSFLLQGAGKINVDSAISTPAFIEPGGIIAKPAETIKVKVTGFATNVDFSVSVEVPEDFKDLVEFEIPNETLSVSEGEEKEIEITPYFNSEQLSTNIECIIWFECDNHKLHVPFICWKDFGASMVSPITGFVVDGENIDYSKDSDQGISINYNVAMGDLYSYKPFAYGDYFKSEELSDTNQTVLSRCQVDLVDGNNDSWITINTLENPEYGHYSFDWDGYVDFNDEDVPNGKYKLKLTKTESLISGSSTESETVSESIIADESITVSGSRTHAPPTFRLYSRPPMPSIDQKFAIDLFITFAVDVSSIALDLTYPPDELEILDVVKGNFMGLDGVEVENDIFNLEEEGCIRVFSKRLGEKGIDGYGLIARIIARCPDVVFPTVGYSDKWILDSDGYLVKHMSFPLELEVTDLESLVGDINFDGIVDVIDITVIARSFGLTTEHPDYNIVADINDDGLVDKADLEKLLANFGKSR